MKILDHTMIDKKYYWDQAYQKKATDQTGWFQEVPQVSLDLIKAAGLAKNSKIIDIGGGDSLLVDHLLSDGFENITVVDISEVALERAKKRLGKIALNVTWILSDVLDINSSEKYDLWHDRACLHFLTAAQDVAQYYKLLQDVLSSKGSVILGAFSESGPLNCSGLPIKQYNIDELNKFDSENLKLLKSLETDHLTPSKAKQNYVFCLFKKIN